MKRITKSELQTRLGVDYDIWVRTSQITTTKTKNAPHSLMIVEGIGGYGLFRYGYNTNGEVKIYPNRMNEIHTKYFEDEETN
jgi:hypothetical protein